RDYSADVPLELRGRGRDARRKTKALVVPAKIGTGVGPVLNNMRPFRRRYTTTKEGTPASDRSRLVRTDKVVGQSGKRTRLAWKPARRAERRSGWQSA